MIVSTLVVGLTLAAPSDYCSTFLRGPMPPLRVPKELSGERKSPKLMRDAWGPCPNEVTSENFVIKWGNAETVLRSDVDSMLGYLENAWAVGIGELGFPPPPGTDAYLFNVYIGSTGSTTPEIESGGYYYVDDAGWPMIVVSTLNIVGDDELAEQVLQHEFFHALEGAAVGDSDGYDYDYFARWYYEACADWMVSIAVPGESTLPLFDTLSQYAYMPEYPVNYESDEWFAFWRPYGLWIFPQFLSEFVGGPDLIRASWVDTRDESDPLVVLRRLLADYGTDLESVVADFAAHNASWDYENGTIYVAGLMDPAEYSGEPDHRIAADVPSTGAPSWTAPNPDTIPQRLGYNIVRLKEPQEGDLHVGFQGVTFGSLRTASRFRVTVVREFEDCREYLPLPLSGAFGELNLPGVGAETAIYLAVASVPDQGPVGEVFDYRFMMSFEEPAAPTPPTPEEGCSSLPPSPSLLCWSSFRPVAGEAAASPNGDHRLDFLG